MEGGTYNPATYDLQRLQTQYPDNSYTFITAIKNAVKSATLHEIGVIADQRIAFIDWMDLKTEVPLPATTNEVATLLEHWCLFKRQGISIAEYRKRLPENSSVTYGQRLSSSIVLGMSENDEGFLTNAGLAVATLFQTEANSKSSTANRDSFSGGMEGGKWGIDMDGDDAMPLVSTNSAKLITKKTEADYTGIRVKLYNIWKAIFLFVTLGCLGYFMVFVQMWSDDRVLNNAKGAPLVPLHDIVYEQYIPAIFKKLPETIVDTPISIGLISSVLFSMYIAGKQDPTRLARRSLLGLIVLYAFRSLSIAVTQVPPSNPAYCRPFPKTVEEYIPASLDMFSSKTKSCSDMMFSGHTGILSFILIRVWYDSGSTGVRALARYLIRFVVLSVYLASLTTFIAVKLHYTMDVLIGMVIGLSWAISFENTFIMLPLYTGQGIILSVMRWVESTPEPVSLMKVD
ncbi:UNVERIFIED_CONTAM: hypothetical protein HDU68_000345 [Siphonaria sp. JEL0065]|nr:hypothetical protein HDU68_000345 [Siphonaria sp. JEL0065]